MVKRFWLPVFGALIFAFSRLIAFFQPVRPEREDDEALLDGDGGKIRAFLSLTATHFNWDDPAATKGGAAIVCEWTNVGRTVATGVGFSHAMEFVPTRGEAKPTPNLGFIWRPSRGDGKLEPGDKLGCEVGRIPPSIARKWTAGEYVVLVYSAVVYVDVLGTENRVETCNRATCEETNGSWLVTLRPAAFNNSSLYGMGTDKF